MGTTAGIATHQTQIRISVANLLISRFWHGLAGISGSETTDGTNFWQPGIYCAVWV